MEKNQRFVKYDLEENLNQYFSEYMSSGRANENETLPAQAYDLNVGPPCAASERFGGYKANNNNLQQFSHNNNTRSHSKNEGYADFSNDYRKANYVNNEGFSPETSEYISYSNYQNNNPIESSMSHRYGNNNSENLNNTRNYDSGGVRNSYKNEDQLRNNTMFPLNRETLIIDANYDSIVNDGGNYKSSQYNMEYFHNDASSRNKQQYGGNVGTFNPCNDNYATPYYQRNNNDNIGPFNSVSGNNEFFSRNAIDENERQFRTISLPRNRQQEQFGNSGPRGDQSISYDSFSRDNVMERKFQNNSRDKQQLQRLDDGFVCVRNPEYFPDLSRDNEHSSRNVRYEGKSRSNARSKNVRKQSQENILPRGIGRNHATNYNRSGSISREEILHRNERGRESFRRNSRGEDRHAKGSVSHGTKFNKVNTTLESKRNRKYRGEKDGRESYKKNNNNKHTNDDLPHYSRYSSKKRSADRIAPKGISELDSRRKRRYANRNTDLSSGSQNSIKTSPTRSDVGNTTASNKKPETQTLKKGVERKNFFVKLLKKKNRKAFEKRQKKATKVKEKAPELKETGIPKTQSKGQIKSDPEKYWKEWWSKYAYIEKVIEKVDADDETVKEFLKFDYDLNDTGLDTKVRGVFRLALTKIKSAGNINETNYERRVDIFNMLKHMKLLEVKDFQSFLLTKELQRLRTTLDNVKSNKVMLALLYQSIICRWHIISTRLIKSEDQGSAEKVRQANALINDKLFLYLVLDSMQELKKLTLEDWPGFDAFYNNLQ